MSNPLLHKDVLAVLNVGDQSSDDQLAFLTEQGDTIFETALKQFDGVLPEEEKEDLYAYLAGDPSPEELLLYLLKGYEQFESVLKETIQNVQQDVASQ